MARMVDRPEAEEPAEYFGGWAVSAIMAVATVFIVWHFGIYRRYILMGFSVG